MSQFIKIYFTSSMLIMFRILIHPSSGACDVSVVSPHWLRVLISTCVGVSVWLGWGGVHVAGFKASACHTDTAPTQPRSSTHKIYKEFLFGRRDGRELPIVVSQYLP